MSFGVTFDWRNSGLVNQARTESSYSVDGTTGSILSYSNSTKTSKLDNYVNAVKDLVDEGYYTVDEAIEYYDIPDEYIDDIKAGLTNGTVKQEEYIKNYMNLHNATRAEAIEAYNKHFGIDQDGPTLSYNYTPKLESAVCEGVADELYNSREWHNGWFWTWGKDSDESVFEEYLVNREFSSENIVAIASTFNKKYESLSDVLDYTFKDNDEKRNEYQTIYAEALIEQIKAGNEDASKLVCEEIKSSGQKHGLVEAIMKNADSETLKIIYNKYSEINGCEVTERIEDIFKGDQKTEYASAIKYAVLNK